LRRWNEARLQWGRVPIFSCPTIAPEEARRLAKPTSTGFGDLICAWLGPIALAELKDWWIRIPVPANAGGLHHDASRVQLTPEWLQQELALPDRVRLVAAEAAPEGEDWFCTLEQQWHLNSCTETSYETLPWWVRRDVDRSDYYAAYRRVAQRLLGDRSGVNIGDGGAYFALHARRGDRGAPADEVSLRRVVSSLAGRCRHWAVVSDESKTAVELRRLLEEAGYSVVSVYPSRPVVDGGQRTQMVLDLRTLVGASAVISSVRGGWSAFPYAATRISGAPLLVTEPLGQSLVWQVIRAHSRVAVAGVHHGPEGVESVLADL
jgi:hypothetical protein